MLACQDHQSPFHSLQGSISVPGSVGMLPIERPSEIETGFFYKKASLVYHYGFNNPGQNLKLYNSVVTSLAKQFQKRCQTVAKCEYIVVICLATLYLSFRLVYPIVVGFMAP